MRDDGQADAGPIYAAGLTTALIVTQSSVGGSLKAALERFVGSVFGAVAFAIPHGGAVGSAVALVVAVASLSVLAASSAGFRVAPITAITVLLGGAGRPAAGRFSSKRWLPPPAGLPRPACAA